MPSSCRRTLKYRRQFFAVEDIEKFRGLLNGQYRQTLKTFLQWTTKYIQKRTIKEPEANHPYSISPKAQDTFKFHRSRDLGGLLYTIRNCCGDKELERNEKDCIPSSRLEGTKVDSHVKFTS